MLTLPLCIWLLSYQNYSPFLSRVTKGKVDISSSWGKLASSSSLASSLPEPSSLSSSEVGGDREEATMKPPMAACCHAIRSTRVFTWHNSSLNVSRWASIHTSCAMMASRVTPPRKIKEQRWKELKKLEDPLPQSKLSLTPSYSSSIYDTHNRKVCRL